MPNPADIPPEERPSCFRVSPEEECIPKGPGTDETIKTVDDEGAEDTELQRFKCFDLGIAYVANFGGDSVSAVDVARTDEIARIPVGTGPYAVAASPDKRFVYVSNFVDNTLSVIRTLSNTVIATIDLNAGPFTSSGPEGVAVSHDSRFVYVANYLSANISVVDAHQLTVVAEIPLTSWPTAIGITPDGNAAYVTLWDKGVVAIVDLNTNLQVGTVAVGVAPEGIDMACHKPLAYVALQGAPHVRAVNTDVGMAAVTPIAVGASSTGVSFNPNATLAYVTNKGSDTVSVIDVFRHAKILTIPVGDGPVGVKVAKNGFAVVVANQDSSTVSIIDARTSNVTATVPVGSGPVYVDII